MAEMIADIYKVGPLKYRKIFQCHNGSEFKGDVTKILEKNEVKIRRVMTKYKHTHTAFVEALNKILASCRLWHGSRVVILKIEKSQ